MKAWKQSLAGFCLTAAISAAAAASPPPDFHAKYNLYLKGVKVAKIERRFSRSSDGAYHYRSETRTTGLISLFRKDRIVEESRGRINDDTIQPIHYKYSRTGSDKAREVAIHFDWDENQVTNRINGDAWEMDTESGMLDKLLYQFVLMRDLKAGKTPLTYTVADGGKTKTYHFESLGRETIETPLGEMETIKLSRRKSNSKREMILWCAPELHYLPVKVKDIEEDGNSVAIINSLEGLDK